MNWGQIQADLPRNPNGTAIIGDPRNDENRVISQMQPGFLRFDNSVVDQLVAKGTSPDHLFEEAGRPTTWHYQWIEGLGPVGARLVAEVLIGLMELDSRSYLGSNRNWSPLDSADKIGSNGVRTLFDLLTL